MPVDVCPEFVSGVGEINPGFDDVIVQVLASGALQWIIVDRSVKIFAESAYKSMSIDGAARFISIDFVAKSPLPFAQFIANVVFSLMWPEVSPASGEEVAFEKTAAFFVVVQVLAPSVIHLIFVEVFFTTSYWPLSASIRFAVELKLIPIIGFETITVTLLFVVVSFVPSPAGK